MLINSSVFHVFNSLEIELHSLQLIPIQILILMRFAKKNLAETKVRPNLTSSSPEKYKGLSKLLKGKYSKHTFQFLNLKTII